MKTFIIVLIVVLSSGLFANAQQICLTPTIDQTKAAQYLTTQWNTERGDTLTVKQYVTMRITGSEFSDGVFNTWVRDVNEDKAKKINLSGAYRAAPDSVKDQIKVLLEPYKDN